MRLRLRLHCVCVCVHALIRSHSSSPAVENGQNCLLHALTMILGSPRHTHFSTTSKDMLLKGNK